MDEWKQLSHTIPISAPLRNGKTEFGRALIEAFLRDQEMVNGILTKQITGEPYTEEEQAYLDAQREWREEQERRERESNALWDAP